MFLLSVGMLATGFLLSAVVCRHFRRIRIFEARSRKGHSARRTTEEARQRVEFLYRATAELHASSLDSHRILEHLALSLVPRFADWAGAVRLTHKGEVIKIAMHSGYGRSAMARDLLENYP